MFNSIKIAYFLGIGGIGMSAIARFLNTMGIAVYGYDRTPTALTNELINEGITIHFDDDVALIPNAVLEAQRDELLIIVTPAIPHDHKEYNYFKAQQYIIKKRAEVLGQITRVAYSAAVAGTHGKTTTSTLLTHILKHSGYDVTAFLGGVAKNYNSNHIVSHSNQWKNKDCTSYNTKVDVLLPIVVEADEYDRSFLTLFPDIAIITSVDPDHLDIYGDDSHLKESFTLFTKQIKENGTLISKKGLQFAPELKPNVQAYHYALNTECDFYAANIRIEQGKYKFDIKSSIENINNVCLGLPGLHNVENAIAAVAAAQIMGVLPFSIKEALESFQGVHRRFDYIINTPNLVYIDDYAHHPEEIKACVHSLKELFPLKKITGIFQPHLYSRTRDFATEFSESLSLLDEVILMDIYPARELPIEGVSSAMLLNNITSPEKSLMGRDQILELFKNKKPEVLVTIGAGDIDQMVETLEKVLTHV